MRMGQGEDEGVMRRFLVTGGAGFIGSAVARRLVRETSHEVLVVDKLTYAGNRGSLASIAEHPRFRFEQADIGDQPQMQAIIAAFELDVIMNLAAESHVDRSIDGPSEFIHTNVVGTLSLLQVALGYWQGISAQRHAMFRFHLVSTDEVFGSLGPEEPPLVATVGKP